MRGNQTSLACGVLLGVGICGAALVASAATEIKPPCGRLLSYAVLGAPEQISPLPADIHFALDASRQDMHKAFWLWNFESPQTAADLEPQLQALFDQILVSSFEGTPLPRAYELPQYAEALDSLRHSISLFVKAFTESDHSGFLNFRDIATQQHPTFNALKKEAEASQQNLGEGIHLSWERHFHDRIPIPHFTIAGTKMKWIVRLMPNSKDRGFRIGVKYLDRSTNQPARREESLMKGLLSDRVFGREAIRSPSIQTFRIVNQADAPVPASKVFFSLDDLTENRVGKINIPVLQNQLVDEINLRMLQYLCGSAGLCRKFNQKFAHELRRRYAFKGLKRGREATYTYEDMEHFIPIILRDLQIEHRREQKLTYSSFMKWNGFKAFAEHYTHNYNENNWDAAIAYLKKHKLDVQHENSTLYFQSSDNFFAHRLQPTHLHVNYAFTLKLFDENPSLEAVDITSLKLMLQPTFLAYEALDLNDTHIDLLLTRWQELLGRP